MPLIIILNGKDDDSFHMLYLKAAALGAVVPGCAAAATTDFPCTSHESDTLMFSPGTVAVAACDAATAVCNTTHLWPSTPAHRSAVLNIVLY